MDKKHYVYILRCSDGTYYTGYTIDPERRTQVITPARAKYTRARRPVRLIYTEEYDVESEAQRREYAIKAAHSSREGERSMVKPHSA